MIVAAGEVVADLIEDPRRPGRFRFRPGGAPANLAAQAARLGVDAALVARFGGDSLGVALRSALELQGVGLGLSGVGDEPTTTALVGGTPGDPRFVLYYEGTASARLSLPPSGALPWPSVSWLAVSGVALLWPQTADALRALVRDARAHGVGIALDLNWRAGLAPDAASWRRALGEVAEASHLIKGTAEEWARWDATGPLGTTSCHLTTLGAAGARVVTTGGLGGDVGGVSIRPRSVVGAGDSFLGAVLACLDARGMGPSGLGRLGSEDWEGLLAAGNTVAGMACGRVVPDWKNLPTAEAARRHAAERTAAIRWLPEAPEVLAGRSEGRCGESEAGGRHGGTGSGVAGD